VPLDQPPLPRAEFPVAERWVYLNHAGIAPLCRSAFEAARAADETWMLDGGEAEQGAFDRTEEVRAAVAELMGATAAEVYDAAKAAASRRVGSL
jgi:hypothetical protein